MKTITYGTPHVELQTISFKWKLSGSQIRLEFSASVMDFIASVGFDKQSPAKDY